MHRSIFLLLASATPALAQNQMPAPSQSAQGDVDLHTSGGDLRLGNVEGDLVAKTSGGSIHLNRQHPDVKRILGAQSARSEDMRSDP